MTKEDSGLYTCTVCNSLGCDTAQASLSTEGQSLSKMMPFIVTHVCFLQMLFNVFFFLSLGLCFVLFFVHLQMFFLKIFVVISWSFSACCMSLSLTQGLPDLLGPWACPGCLVLFVIHSQLKIRNILLSV